MIMNWSFIVLVALVAYLWCPSNEHNLLQVSIHTAKHSYVRSPGFRLHLDVHRIVTYRNINWDKFLIMVNDYKVNTITYFSLVIPKQLFNTDIPKYVIDKIKPSYLKEKVIFFLINRAGIYNPNEKKFTTLSFLILTILLHDTPKTIIEIVIDKRKPNQTMLNYLAFLIIRCKKLIFDHTFK